MVVMVLIIVPIPPLVGGVYENMRTMASSSLGGSSCHGV